MIDENNIASLLVRYGYLEQKLSEGTLKGNVRRGILTALKYDRLDVLNFYYTYYKDEFEMWVVAYLSDALIWRSFNCLRYLFLLADKFPRYEPKCILIEIIERAHFKFLKTIIDDGFIDIFKHIDLDWVKDRNFEIYTYLLSKSK